MSDYGYCPTPDCGAPGVKQFRLIGQTKCLNGHRHATKLFDPPLRSPVREMLIESYLAQRVTATGGIVRKVKWPGVDGAPDRLCGWPGHHALVEVKRPGGVAEAHQIREHSKLRAIGFRVYVLDTKEAVDNFVDEMTS